MQFLAIGRILASWGLKGEVKVQVVTDFPESFAAQSQVYLDGRLMVIERSQHHNKHLIVKLATIDDREAADRLRGCDLEIPLSQARPLAEGEYYPLQLIGLKVETTEGDDLGQVVDILATGSNDVYVVRGGRGDTLIPAIEDVIQSIDLKNGVIIIQAIEGLLE